MALAMTEDCLVSSVLALNRVGDGLLYGADAVIGNLPSALMRCHPLSKRGHLGVVNSGGFRIRAARKSALTKRLL